jgi:hypothetical protein
MGGVEVFGHGVGFIEVGDGGGEMCLAGQQDSLAWLNELDFVQEGLGNVFIRRRVA